MGEFRRLRRTRSKRFVNQSIKRCETRFKFRIEFLSIRIANDFFVVTIFFLSNLPLCTNLTSLSNAISTRSVWHVDDDGHRHAAHNESMLRPCLRIACSFHRRSSKGLPQRSAPSSFGYICLDPVKLVLCVLPILFFFFLRHETINSIDTLHYTFVYPLCLVYFSSSFSFFSYDTKQLIQRWIDIHTAHTSLSYVPY